jgi:hypothetical protein
MPSAPARLNASSASITQDSGSQPLPIAARSIAYSPDT